MRSELAIIAVLGLVVLTCFVRLVRSQRDPAVRFWATGWVVLFVVAGLDLLLGDQGDRGGHPAHVFTAVTLSTALPILMLAGAMAWVGRVPPLWLARAGALFCLARGGVAVADSLDAALWMSLPVDAPALCAGAVLILRGQPPALRSAMTIWLGGAYLALAGAEVGLSLVYLDGRFIPVGRVLYGAVALLLGSVQVAAVVSRMRERSAFEVIRRERDLRLLRSVARLGVSHERSEDLVEAVLEILVKDFDLEGAGLWLSEGRGQAYVLFAERGLPEEYCRAHARVDAEHPGIALLRDRDEPVIVDHGGDAAAAEVPSFDDGGFRVAGVVKLRWQNEMLGVLLLTASDAQSLGDAPEALFGAVGDELVLALNHVRAVEEQMRNARELATERRTLAAVLESAPIGILVEGPDHAIDLLNSTGVQHILCEGVPSDWVGRKVSDLAAELQPRIYDPEAKRRTIRDASSRGAVIENLEIVVHDPEERIVTLFVSPVFSTEGEWLGRVWLSRDVTEERRLGEQLRHSQKLETIGTLSGGIAHDFNNQLAVILGNVRYAKGQIDGDDPDTSDLLESLVDLERAADHCAGLTRSLLAFARRAPVAIQSLDVERVLEELSDLLRPLIPRSVEIVVEVEPDLEPLAADPTQIQQVLLNLAVNARDAMKDRGVLELRVSARDVDEEASRGVLGARPGRYIEIAVRDTGCGLDPDSMTRIFEPFYTTKPVGSGTGLGLAIVHGVVSAHAGWLEVESEPGQGSVFRVLLPVAEEAADRPQGAPEEPSASGGETILIVDDESAIRRLARLELERCGFRVLEAEDGSRAMEVFTEHESDVDLVFLDMTMPGRDGLSVRADILERVPDMRVILTSGHPPAELSDEEIAQSRFLHKPYVLSELSTRIRQVLDE